ncbi:MmcQ/YjbR family DNA-binding protein [Christensenellaceae bacterium OttesenSCG-928-K19]|nr:MmcQ/YjbR family DNA-binding protein [Christensenellaceae bacterium OttesenSCG-928-K19]
MLEKEDIIAYSLGLPGVYEDHPFGGSIVALRHKANKKSFVFLIYAHGRLHVNLKCEPLRAELLRQTYAGVIPGYHMNKAHWNSVFLDEDIPDSEIFGMIKISYELTKPKRKAK